MRGAVVLVHTLGLELGVVLVHGQRGRFGTYKGTEVSFWYIKGEEVSFWCRLRQRGLLSTYLYILLPRSKHKVTQYEEQKDISA